MKDEDVIQYLEEAFGAKAVPYWKLKHPPNWEELNRSLNKIGSVTPDDLERHEKAKEDLRLQKYWENRARTLAATPNIKRSDVLTTMEGVATNPELIELLKLHLKRAK